MKHVKGQKVLYEVRGQLVLARIKTRHRDGTVTVHPMWFLNRNGDPVPSYLGKEFEFRSGIGGLILYEDRRNAA